MKVLLFQIDGKIPNMALMRISAHEKALGNEVELRRTGQPEQCLFNGFAMPHRTYASGIFRASMPTMERAKLAFPNAQLGGTSVDPPRKDEIVNLLSPVLSKEFTDHGLGEGWLDYSLYPDFKQSLGFTQRGCRLSCTFCVVPGKEGKVRSVATVNDIWRGGDSPREVLLLDNDFFGQAPWRDRIAEMRDGRFKVSFNQGINSRCITDEAAEAIASVDYRADDMKTKRIYTAWDSLGDEERLFSGLNLLVKYGVKPDHIMVYILIGYWPGETAQDRDYRRKRLRDFGCRPYPMPYLRTPELVGFQRWVIGAYDKRFTWEQWSENRWRPEGLMQKMAS